MLLDAAVLLYFCGFVLLRRKKIFTTTEELAWKPIPQKDIKSLRRRMYAEAQLQCLTTPGGYLTIGPYGGFCDFETQSENMDVVPDQCLHYKTITWTFPEFLANVDRIPEFFFKSTCHSQNFRA